MTTRCPQCDRLMEGSPLACGEHGVPREIQVDEWVNAAVVRGMKAIKDRDSTIEFAEQIEEEERHRGTPYDPVD